MSSAEVAAYLYEVGSNQRKLEYCRQITAANTNFIPQCIFNVKPPHNTNTQTKVQFIQSIRNLGLGCTPQEEELIFSYFQIDNKNYITFDEFEQLIVPQIDPSYKKLILKRKVQEFTLDYALRFALQKYFFQMIENQVKLELICKFTFAKDKKEEKRTRPKRLDTDGFVYFMNVHNKFPDKKTCEFVVREINFNKGQNRRNILIVDYILEFNEKHKHKQPLPTVAYKDVTFVPPPPHKTQPYENKENKSNNFQQSKYSPEQKPFAGYATGNNGHQELSNSFIVNDTQTQAGKTFSAINEVQNRIRALMNEVNIKKTNLEPAKNLFKFQKLKDEPQKEEIQKVPELKNSILEQIKSQLKREKEGKSQPKSDSNFKNINIKGRTDREYDSNRNDFELQAMTSRKKADLILQSKIKKGQSFELDNQSFGSSQGVLKPKSKLLNPPSLDASQKLKELGRSSKYEYLSNNRNKQAEEGKKRLEYLKSLIEEKDIGAVAKR